MAFNRTSDKLGSKLHHVPLTNAINNFGLQLIRKLNAARNDMQTKNVAFSPLSISQIFSMIISGARNETLAELMDAFGFNDQLKTPENVDHAFRILLGDYDLKKNKREINLVLRSIALYSNFKIEESFVKNLRNNYKADARQVDFSDTKTLNAINDFVNKNTNGLIPKLVDQLDPSTVLGLVNAFYFKGEWVDRFDKNLVRACKFYNADTTTSKVQTMFRKGDYDYFEDNNVQSISLPYSGNAAMTILFPKKNRSINDSLNIDLIDYYRSQMRSYLVKLQLPKFRIESTINLKKPITDMGVVKVFAEKEAELGGISNLVYVDEAIHKAFLDVDEVGTEAACATIAIISKCLGPAPSPRLMVIDRPFVFFIHDTLNNLILFMGSVKKL